MIYLRNKLQTDGLDLSMWTEASDKTPQPFTHVRVIIHGEVPRNSYYVSYLKNIWLNMEPSFGASLVPDQDTPSHWILDTDYQEWFRLSR